MRYDIAIIGSGPAALSAAINAKIRNKNIIMFGSKNLSNKLIKAPIVDNYLGFYNVTGVELMESFKKHLDDMDIEIVNKKINNVYAMGDYFALMSGQEMFEATTVIELMESFKKHLDDMDIEIVNKKINNVYAMGDYFALMSGQEMFEATTVILGTGVEFSRAIDGEEQFLGRGVGYCATCDAPLYKGKTVAIIGHTPDAESEANYIDEIAEKTYYIPVYDIEKTTGAGDISENVEVISSKAVRIEGDTHVNKLILKDREIDVDGIFILKDSVSPGVLVPGLEIEGAHIKVNRDMSTNIKGCFAAGDCTGKPYQFMKAAGEGVPGLEIEGAHIKVNRDMSTNIKGCFAAGDCTGKPYQFMKAAGEGQVAGLSAVSYLSKLDK